MTQPDIELVWEHIGGEPPRGHGKYRKVLCPFHNDRKPSATLSEDRFYCFVCDIKCNATGLLAQHLGITYQECLGWLRKHGADLYTEDQPATGGGNLRRSGGSGSGGLLARAGSDQGRKRWSPSWKSL